MESSNGKLPYSVTYFEERSEKHQRVDPEFGIAIGLDHQRSGQRMDLVEYLPRQGRCQQADGQADEGQRAAVEHAQRAAASACLQTVHRAPPAAHPACRAGLAARAAGTPARPAAGQRHANAPARLPPSTAEMYSDRERRSDSVSYQL
ncbi:MAG: hypothetical protein WDW38_008601 [Sanguina aurantia]